jgi:hypothetical protein
MYFLEITSTVSSPLSQSFLHAAICKFTFHTHSGAVVPSLSYTVSVFSYDTFYICCAVWSCRKSAILLLYLQDRPAVVTLSSLLHVTCSAGHTVVLSLSINTVTKSKDGLFWSAKGNRNSLFVCHAMYLLYLISSVPLLSCSSVVNSILASLQ